MIRAASVYGIVGLTFFVACVGDDPNPGAAGEDAGAPDSGAETGSVAMPGDPALELSAQPLSIVQGGRDTLKLHLVRRAMNGPVTIQLAGIPNEVTLPASLVIDALSDELDVEVNVALNAVPRVTKIQATAQAESITHTIEIPLAIRGVRGTLDRAFGAEGNAAPPTNSGAALHDAVALEDGTFIAVGTGKLSGDGPESPVATLVTHYDSDGRVNPTFGSGSGTVSFIEPWRTSYYGPSNHSTHCDSSKCRISVLGFDDNSNDYLLDTDVALATGIATRVQTAQPTAFSRFLGKHHILSNGDDARLWFHPAPAQVGQYRNNGSADVTWNGGLPVNFEQLISKSDVEITAVQPSSTSLFVLLSPQERTDNQVSSRASHFVLLNRQTGAVEANVALASPGSDLIRRTLSPVSSSGEVFLARATDTPCVAKLSRQGLTALPAIDAACFSDRLFTESDKKVSALPLSDQRLALVVYDTNEARLWILNASGAAELPSEGTLLEGFAPAGTIVRLVEDPVQKRLIMFAAALQPQWIVRRYWL